MRERRRARQRMHEWVLEDTFVYRDHESGEFVLIHSFKYPAWFLASISVALCTLGFNVSGAGGMWW